MSVKSVLKKKFKIKNPISSLKKRKQKNKINTLEPSVDTYNKLDVDNLKNDHSIPDKVKNKILVTDETSTVVDGSVTKMSKKRKSVDTVDESEPSKKKSSKKRVTFAADVKSETDQKCTAGNMMPSSLNKRKKLNYIKKLKAKKNKQKNAKKCEENATAASTPRQERAVEYLMEWKNDRSNWKFKKIDQLWLIKNTYDSVKASIYNMVNSLLNVNFVVHFKIDIIIFHIILPKCTMTYQLVIRF